MIKKSIGTFAIKSLGYVFGYLFAILITRKFGADVYGNFSTYFSIVMIFESFAAFGLGIANVRVLSANPSQSLFKFLYKNSISIITISCVFFGALLVISAGYISTHFFSKPELFRVIQLAGLSILPSAIIKYHSNLFRAIDSPFLFAFFQFLSKHFFAIISVLLMTLFMSEQIVVVIGYLVALIFQSIFSYFLLKGRKFKVLEETSSVQFKEVFYIGLNLMFSGVALILMGWVDTLMLTKFTSQNDVGIYNIAMKVALLTTFGMISINSVITPQLAKTWADNDLNKFKNIATRSSRYIFVVTTLIIIFIILFDDLLMGLFGAEFLRAKEPLLIILIGQGVNALCGPSAQVLQMTKYEQQFRNILFVAVILNIVLNLVLIPMFSINGAAISSSISVSFWNLSAVYLIKRKFDFYVFPRFSRDKK